MTPAINVGLGIGIGSTALRSARAGRPDVTRTPAVLYLPADAEPFLGLLALEAAKTNSGSVFRDFIARAGDPVPMVVDRLSRSGAELVAAAVRLLVRDRDAENTEVAVAYPTAWSDFAVRETAAALARNGVRPTLVAAAEAAYVELAETRQLPAGASVLLCDVRGAATSVAAVRAAEDGTVRVFRPSECADFGGDVVDALLTEHVLAEIAAANPGFDPSERWNWDGVRALRAQVRRAKEQLSSDVSATIEVNLLGIHENHRVVRSELEALIDEPVRRVVAHIGDAVEAARAAGREIDTVVLTGGGAAVPLLTERLSAALRLPVRAAADPAATTVRGAARIAARVAARRPAARPAEADLPMLDAGPAAGALPVVRNRAAPRTPRRRVDPPPTGQPPPRRPAAVRPMPVQPERRATSPVRWALAVIAALALLAGGGFAADELGHGQSNPPGASHALYSARR